MLEGASILCFAHEWGADSASATHIMRILARRNRVLWVEAIGDGHPATPATDPGKGLAGPGRGLERCVEVEPDLLVAGPLVLPGRGDTIGDSVNGNMVGVALRRLCERSGLRRPILWSFVPTALRLVGRLGERLAIYHRADDGAARAGAPPEAFARMEESLARRAHVVFASTASLRDEHRPLNPHTYLVSRGVDVAHFSRALEPLTQVPPGLRNLPRPVVGFFGLPADWIDLDLVRDVAVARPGWSFAVVGQAATSLALARLPNVHLLGPRPYTDLPACLKGLDAAILPLRGDAPREPAHMPGLREYLAAGIPVVSTPFPASARYRGLVRRAERAEEFVREAEGALAERSPELDRRRAETMRAESWEARVEEMTSIIRRSLRAGR